MTLTRRSLPSLVALQALDALDQFGSVSAAASYLNLTQSAVSRQLQTLETQIGVPLFRRDRKALRLSPEGQRYLDTVRPALDQIVQAGIHARLRPRGGTLNLAILPAFGMRWLMPRLPEFTRCHPEVTLNMSTRLNAVDIAGEGFDAAIRFGVPPWPGCDALLLRHEQVVPVAAPELLADARIRQPKDLLGLPLLHIETRPHAWNAWFAHYDQDIPGAVPGMMFDQFATIAQAAEHGLGVALMPDYLVEEPLATGRLRRAYGGAVDAEGQYHLVWPKSSAPPQALGTFIDWIAGQAQPEDLLPR